MGGAAGGSEVGLAVPLSTSSTLVIFLEGFTVPVDPLFYLSGPEHETLRPPQGYGRHIRLDLFAISCKIKQQVTLSSTEVIHRLEFPFIHPWGGA